jgi:hypothetical protein
MKPENFVIWLKGFLDCSGNVLTAEQIKTLKNKLDTCIDHEVANIQPNKEVINTQSKIPKPDMDCSNFPSS